MDNDGCSLECHYHNSSIFYNEAEQASMASGWSAVFYFWDFSD